MHQARLAALIKNPEVQQEILRGYQGYYSLGLTLNPENRRELAISVRVESDNVENIARQIVLDGQAVPVIVHSNYQMPIAR